MTESSAPSAAERYFVKLKDTVVKDDHLAWLTPQLGDHSTITHNWDSDFFHGFAGAFSPHIIEILRTHADVEYIEEDHPTSLAEIITQSNAPWGLGRINQDPALSSHSTTGGHVYTYHSSAGTGVDIYVLDSGIYIQHDDFDGRARFGKTCVKKVGGFGHGTHVAGIAAGKQYGVAKAANIIDVRVYGPKSLATDIADGLQWVRNQAIATRRPSIANMSVITSKNKAIDDMVASTTRAGIHVIVGAGNNSKEADKYSPAGAASAITVGSSDIFDEVSSFSNFGPAVNLFAPGEFIISCGIKSHTDTDTRTGTSMSTPHVSGIVARQIALYGNVSPQTMAADLKSMCVAGVLTKIPKDTVNLLARSCILTEGKLLFQSDWAEFSVESPRISLRKIEKPSSEEYSDVTWTLTSIKWGKSGGSFGNKNIRFLVVNDGSPTTGSICRGTDGSKVGDKAGEATVNLANCDYVNKGDLTTKDNKMTYNPCPVETDLTVARFSFASNWASVTVETPGACLRKLDGTNYTGATLTSKSLQWGTEDSTTYSSQEISYEIVCPAPLCDIHSTLLSLVDITLAHGNDSAKKDDGTGWSKTSFGNYEQCTYENKKTSAQRFNNCPVTPRKFPASLSFKSNWAEFGLKSPGFTISKDPKASASIYNDVTFTITSLRWGSDKTTTYKSASIPFYITGPYDLVDIYLAHGSDGEKQDDKKGTSSVSFANREYTNSELTSGDSRNLKVVTKCPTETIVASATLSVKSNWGKVSLLSPGASLRKDKDKEKQDSKIYDGTKITLTTFEWGDSTKENYAEKDIPFQILVPSPPRMVDFSISHGNDKSKKDDKSGSASVKNFGWRNYVNDQIVPDSDDRNKLVFDGCSADY